MSLTCVSLTCAHQKGLFCRVASGVIVVSSPDTYYLWGQTFFCFYLSAPFPLILTLTTHSGSLIGTQEGDQEPSPRPQTKTKTNRHSRPGDGDAPIYQLTLERAESSRSVSWCHEYNKMTSSERTGKFKQIHESSNCLLTFASFETLPSSPPPLPPQHVVYTFCPHISATGSQGNVYTVR